jgi:hypothetical protein
MTPKRVSHAWAYDFVEESTWDSHKLRMT